MELQMLLDSGDILFESLEQETLACLKNIESMPAEDIEYFVGKRQAILDAIQLFDKELPRHLPGAVSSGEAGTLERFRQRQAALLRRLAEADGLLLALAEIELTSLKAKLSGISRGRHALNGYREEGEESRSSLKNIA